MSEQASIPRRKRVFSHYTDDLGTVVMEDGTLSALKDGNHVVGHFYGPKKRNHGQKPRTRILRRR